MNIITPKDIIKLTPGLIHQVSYWHVLSRPLASTLFTVLSYIFQSPHEYAAKVPQIIP